jgi:two-component system, OmpR family, response regulator CpxR
MQAALPNRFLIVDDDRELVELLIEYLSAAGITASTAADGAVGLAKALECSFDLVILDVMLPHLNGFEVLRQLRKRSTVPVIMLTARHQREDRITGLETGADDYLPKPFDPDELLARARAVLRRAKPSSSPLDEVIEVGEIAIRPHHHVVRHGDRHLDLTGFEFEILDLLVRPVGRQVTRDEISAVLYQRPAHAYDRSVDVHVSRLRQKLLPAGIRIKSIRGVGYILSSASDGDA